MTKTSRLSHVLPGYLVYTGLFVGTGFLSGAVVHFPFNPVRFAIIGAIGAAIFVASSVVNEAVLNKRHTGVAGILKLIFFSLLLAIGIGMISGGVQHFDEVPVYASKLIPLGVLLSLTGYLVKSGVSLQNEQKMTLGLAAFVFVAMLGTGLGAYAQSIPLPEEEHIHVDGEDEHSGAEHAGG